MIYPALDSVILLSDSKPWETMDCELLEITQVPLLCDLKVQGKLILMVYIKYEQELYLTKLFVKKQLVGFSDFCHVLLSMLIMKQNDRFYIGCFFTEPPIANTIIPEISVQDIFMF